MVVSWSFILLSLFFFFYKSCHKIVLICPKHTIMTQNQSAEASFFSFFFSEYILIQFSLRELYLLSLVLECHVTCIIPVKCIYLNLMFLTIELVSREPQEGPSHHKMPLHRDWQRFSTSVQPSVLLCDSLALTVHTSLQF